MKIFEQDIQEHWKIIIKNLNNLKLLHNFYSTSPPHINLKYFQNSTTQNYAEYSLPFTINNWKISKNIFSWHFFSSIFFTVALNFKKFVPWVSGWFSMAFFSVHYIYFWCFLLWKFELWNKSFFLENLQIFWRFFEDNLIIWV